MATATIADEPMHPVPGPIVTYACPGCGEVLEQPTMIEPLASTKRRGCHLRMTGTGRGAHRCPVPVYVDAVGMDMAELAGWVATGTLPKPVDVALGALLEAARRAEEAGKPTGAAGIPPADQESPAQRAEREFCEELLRPATRTGASRDSAPSRW